MRTTLTLDDDVAIALRARARESGESFKNLVNTYLRDRLASPHTPRKRAPRFRTLVVDSGPPAMVGVHSVSELLAFAEGDAHP